MCGESHLVLPGYHAAATAFFGVANLSIGDIRMVGGSDVFRGCMPALMTPCRPDRTPDFAELVRTARRLVEEGMSAVVYCGSMGEWPLLDDDERKTGVRLLVEAGVPVIVGTGARNPRLAAAHAQHAREVGAAGLMVLPRVLSRGNSPAAQEAHFSRVLAAAGDLPAVIYNSPHYGFQTRADLFFALRRRFPNLVGFKEFGGADALSSAAEFITSGDPDLALMVGVDTQVVHGFVRCGAVGAITGIGNALPQPVLRLVALCRRAAGGDVEARRLALELDEALRVLATFDEGPDLVLHYKLLMVLEGHSAYELHLDADDELSVSQRAFTTAQWKLFRDWWAAWPGATTAPGADHLHA
jgi:1-pyrroline-4-hydroxy-2-carboxylate deaminase